MRDAEQENAFVEAFIVPERRERYRYMLANPKKRHAFLDRLCHCLDFLPSLAHQISGGAHNVEGIARMLNDRGVKDIEVVYVFSSVSEIDAQSLPLRRALEEVIDAEFGSVVCCLAGKLAYYRPEAPGRGYLLEKR